MKQMRKEDKEATAQGHFQCTSSWGALSVHQGHLGPTNHREATLPPSSSSSLPSSSPSLVAILIVVVVILVIGMPYPRHRHRCPHLSINLVILPCRSWRRRSSSSSGGRLVRFLPLIPVAPGDSEDRRHSAAAVSSACSVGRSEEEAAEGSLATIAPPTNLPSGVAANTCRPLTFSHAGCNNPPCALAAH